MKKPIEQIKEAGAELDRKADQVVTEGQTILEKLKQSKWTAAAVAGAGLVAAFLIIK